LLLDRLLTLTLFRHLASDASEGSLKKLAAIHFSQRIDLAKVCGAVSDGTADDLQEVNRVRNLFAHFKPSRTDGGWSFDGVPELAQEAAYEKCAERGVKALQALMVIAAKITS
jgi:hypothetical protein